MSYACITCHAAVELRYKSCPQCGQPISDFLRQCLATPLAGCYRIVARLGGGGMGEVYAAYHDVLGCHRVIKVMRPELLQNEALRSRFKREARLAQMISNDHVAKMHEVAALPDGSYYMVWEYIEGEDLATVLRKSGALSPPRVAQLAIQILRGLEAIHNTGVVHRDISPDNIMLVTDAAGVQTAKIIDLGIAKGERADELSLTLTGMFLGKLRYAAPEQIRPALLGADERIDGRADIYSLGVMMYELLTGAAPFDGERAQDFVAAHLYNLPKPFLPQGAPRPVVALQTLVLRSLEKDRQLRLGAKGFREALEALLSSLQDSGVTTTQLMFGRPEPALPTPVPVLNPVLSTTTPDGVGLAERTAPAHVTVTPRRWVAAVAIAVAMILAVIAGIQMLDQAAAPVSSSPVVTSRLVSAAAAPAVQKPILKKTESAPAPTPSPMDDLIRDATSGNASAQLLLGSRYYAGKDVPRNFAEAARWYRAAADAGNLDAQYAYARLLARGEGVRRDSTEATRRIKEAAAKQHDASRCLALFPRAFDFELEKSEIEGPEQIVAACKTAAERGVSDAQMLMAVAALADADPNSEDLPPAARKWLSKAATRGNEYAIAFLASEKLEDSNPDNDLAAIRSVMQAVKVGYATAIDYWTGYFGPHLTDEDRAARLTTFRKLAAEGFAPAQTALGDWFEQRASDTLLKDDLAGARAQWAEAAQWYAKASKQGHLEATYQLAAAYWHGFGVPENPAEAIRLFKVTANADDSMLASFACQKLADIYRKGEGGVQADSAEEIRWLERAIDIQRARRLDTKDLDEKLAALKSAT